MFKEPTVFVLGAGASCEFGLPLGFQLLGKIAERFTDSQRLGVATPRVNEFAALISRTNIGGFHYNNTQDYLKTSASIARGLKYANSIDDFIEYKADNKPLQAVAKAAICQQIIESEKASSLYVKNGERTFKHTSSWYHALWKTLRKGVTKIDDLFDPNINPVTFITFNYDRTLEHFFYHAAMDDFDVSPNKALSVLPIHHVYGHVGLLPWQKDYNSQQNGISYGDSQDILRQNPLLLKPLTDGIKTYTEEVESTSVMKIRKTIAESRKIYCMGMAYHTQNVELLFPTESQNNPPPLSTIKAYLECVDLPKTAQEKASNAFKMGLDRIPCVGKVVLAEGNAKTFYNDHRALME